MLGTNKCENMSKSVYQQEICEKSVGETTTVRMTVNRWDWYPPGEELCMPMVRPAMPCI